MTKDNGQYTPAERRKYQREYRKTNKQSDYAPKWRAKNPLKYKAHIKAQKKADPAKSAKGLVQHHDDHSKPLRTRWVSRRYNANH